MLNKYSAFFVGLLVTLSSLCHFASLFAFFFASNKATRFRQIEKKKIDHDFKAGGQRNAIQVFSNGAVPVLFSISFVLAMNQCTEISLDFQNNYIASFCTLAVLASFSCSCGDTLASELGPVLTDRKQSTVFHLIKCKQVPKGTNGGVSIMGTLASCLGGLIVGCAYYLALKLSLLNSMNDSASPDYLLITFGGLSGFLGSFIDSVLGGLLQYSGVNEKTDQISNEKGPGIKHVSGLDILTNNQVNLLSALITSITVPYFASFYI